MTATGFENPARFNNWQPAPATARDDRKAAILRPPPPSDWTARVWGAMARDCPRKPEACAEAFSIVCHTGWPYTGKCEACGKSWAVMPDKIGKPKQ